MKFSIDTANLSFDKKANIIISRKIKFLDFHKISHVLVSFETVLVGMIL